MRWVAHGWAGLGHDLIAHGRAGPRFEKHGWAGLFQGSIAHGLHFLGPARPIRSSVSSHRLHHHAIKFSLHNQASHAKINRRERHILPDTSSLLT
jgi:hypothetical protein